MLDCIYMPVELHRADVYLTVMGVPRDKHGRVLSIIKHRAWQSMAGYGRAWNMAEHGA